MGADQQNQQRQFVEIVEITVYNFDSGLKFKYNYNYKVNNEMNIIKKLPDDIILYIYTKCLKRYRMHEGQLIKMIDLDKYKFLEKYVHRIPNNAIRMFNFNSNHDGECKVRYCYQLSNLSGIDRIESSIDDDMLFITLTTMNDSSLLRYEIERYRLKKIEDFTIKPVRSPSIYYKGAYDDYDWEIVKYSYEI